jgi:hypothetical protein
VLPPQPTFTDSAVPVSAPAAGIGDTAAFGGQRGVVAP